MTQEESWNRVMLLFIYGPEDLDVLQDISDKFRNDLLASGEVTQIRSWGMPEKEIRVNVSPSLLREYGLTTGDIESAIRSSDLNIAAGTVNTGTENLQIRSYGRRTTVAAIEEIPVLAAGSISLGQICKVTEEWPSEAVYTRANGKPAVGFDIMYTNAEDVLVISNTVDEIIEEASLEYGDLVSFKPFIRDSEQIEERLGTLSISGLLGLLLVVLILGIFLNLRLSLWVAFAPYFFIYGEMGQYTSQIGLVIILCLAFSLIEAAIILPVHLAHSRALGNQKNSGKFGHWRRGLDRFQEGLIHKVYAPVLKAALSHRGLSLAVMAAVLLILGGAMAGNHVRAMFFPEVEMPYSYAEIAFPAGTSAAVVDEIRDEITETALALGAEELWALPEEGYENALMDVLSWGDSRRVWVYFIMIPNEDRPYSTSDFSSALNERIGVIPEAESFKLGEESAFGGYPVSIRFVGEDRESLEKAAGMLKTELARIDGVKDITDDTPLGARELVFSLNDRGKAIGLSTGFLASQIRDGWYGKEVTRINDGPRQIPVVLRMDADERRSLNQLDRYPVRTPSGEWVLTGDVMDYDIERGLHQIKRENGFRAIRVNAGFDDTKNDLNVVLSEINKEIIPSILNEVPGVSLSAGGQAEEVDRMMKSMLFAMIGALIVMFTILMTATGSVGQAFIIIALIPLGFVGAVFGHMIMGLPVSFLSFLGVLALAGIIVNDSVVFISTYNRLVRKEGIPAAQAVFQTGLRRFRPILMTTLTTSIGLTPLIFQKSVGGQFLVPIAVSIAYGLLFGTFLTLILLPCVLSLMADFNHWWKSRREKQNVRCQRKALITEAAIVMNQE